MRACLIVPVLLCLLVGCGTTPTPAATPADTPDVIATQVARMRATSAAGTATAVAAAAETTTALAATHTPTHTATPTPTATDTPAPTPTLTPTPLPPSALQGQVLDESSGQPVEGAQVAAGKWLTATDASGHFIFPNLPPGQYTVLVTAEDYDPVLSGIVEVSAGEQTVMDAALPPAGAGQYPEDPMATNQIDPAGAPTAQDAERLARQQGFQGEVASIQPVTLSGEYLVNYRKGDAIHSALATLHHPAWELVGSDARSWYVVKVCGNLALARVPSVDIPAKVEAQPHPVVTVGDSAIAACADPSEPCDVVVELPAGWHGIALACSEECEWLQVQAAGVAGGCWVPRDQVEALGALNALPTVSQAAGGKIAFFSDRDREPGWVDIYVMNPDGSQQERITSGLEVVAPSDHGLSGLEGRLDWSPAQHRFFYLSLPLGQGSALHSIGMDGHGNTFVTDRVLQVFDLSPDGKRIAYGTSGTPLEIAVLNLDSSDGKALTNQTTREILGIRPDSFLLGPAWSPDGKQIAFYSAADGSLSMIRPDGSEPVRLSADIGVRGAIKIDWSPDGRHLAFAILDQQPPGWDLGTLEIDSGQVHKLVEDGYAPAWSPNSSQIAFQRSDGHIWVVNADGTGLTQLTFSGQNCCAVWMP